MTDIFMRNVTHFVWDYLLLLINRNRTVCTDFVFHQRMNIAVCTDDSLIKCIYAVILASARASRNLS